MKHSGKIIHYNAKKGRGFIRCEKFFRDVVLHKKDLPAGHRDFPSDGQKVHFLVREVGGLFTGTLEATDVVLGEKPAKSAEDKKPNLLWDGPAVVREKTCYVRVSENLIAIDNSGLFSNFKLERRLSRISELVLTEGWITDSLLVRGGGEPILLETYHHKSGNIRKLFAVLQSRINKH